MRRLFFWYIPVAAAIAAMAGFGYGFYLAIFNSAGTAIVEPANAIRAQSAALPGPIRLLIFGDSVARGVGDEHGLGIEGSIAAELKQRKLEHVPIVNLAVSGSRTSDVLALLGSRGVQRLLAGSNVVVISIGGNDLNILSARNSKDPPALIEGALERINQIVKQIRAVNGEARIYLLGLYNPFGSSTHGAILSASVNRWNAELVRSFESDSRLTVVQISDLFLFRDRLSVDRFHPGGEAYRIIGRRIVESL